MYTQIITKTIKKETNSQKCMEMAIAQIVIIRKQLINNLRIEY